MATPDVIRDVGTTLLFLLRRSLPAAMVDPTRITVATPDEFQNLQRPQRPAVTLFLYRLGVASEVRNSPRRMVAGGRSTRPLLPLELHYLITPWAAQTTDEHRILGRILQIFYDHGEVGPAELQGDSWAAGDSAQVVLEALSIEDHYRIWDSTNLPYRLSLTYMVRVIGIEPAEVVSAAPVLEGRFQGPEDAP